MVGRLRRTWAGGVLTSALILAGLGICEFALAEAPLTESQILELLKQKRLMRCPVREAACGAEQRLPKEAKAEFQIFFAYGSSSLDQKARAALVAFARKIKKFDRAGATLQIEGHADGRGSNEFNQWLSERRAAAVKDYLNLRLGFLAEKLVAAGHGKQKLKNVAKPFSGANRRVTISNVDAR